jgi:hypothetical protein
MPYIVDQRKEIPILFSTQMVQAILKGRKTMTRRIVKPQPSTISVCSKTGEKAPFKYKEVSVMAEDLKTTKQISTECEGPYGDIIKCPYGKPGDLLWVRETLYQEGELGLYYVADNEPILEETLPEDYTVYRNYAHCKVPNIHMQKSVARIWLEVTDIRVERLQEISEDDAKAEGVEIIKICNLSDPNDKIRYRDYRFYDAYAPKARLWVTAKRSFETLWQSINGNESWNENPWVWVVYFKILSTTGKPNLIKNKI